MNAKGHRPIRMTAMSQQKEQNMNANNRSAGRVGLVLCSALAVAATGCTTSHVHTRTVYVPAPAPDVYASPAPAPQPPPVVVVAAPTPEPVVVIRTESDFYEPLGAYGRWEVVAGYGRCWIPARVEVGWRPYSNGYWQRTDAGWYWASDEPWGWATYHYGRWDWHAQFGWVWVPQTQWAPAWVCWREGGGYVGWAPLRPSVTIGVNIHVGDYEPAYASRAYVFVEHRRMLEPVRPKTVIVNNTTIINQTVNITKIKVVNQTVINEGPRPEVIERETGRKVHTAPAREVRHQEETTVAARERNIPMAKERKSQTPVRTEPQLAAAPATTTRNTQPVETAPAVDRQTVVPSPAAPPSTRTPPARPNIDKPARHDDKRAVELTEKSNANARAAEAKVAMPPQIERANSARSAGSAIEKPVASVTAVPPPVPAKLAHAESPHKAAPEKRVAITPAIVEPRSKPEARPEMNREEKAAAKIGVVPAAPTQKTAPVVKQARPQKPQVSQKEKSRAAEHNQANNEKKADKSKAEEQRDENPASRLDR